MELENTTLKAKFLRGLLKHILGYRADINPTGLKEIRGMRILTVKTSWKYLLDI